MEVIKNIFTALAGIAGFCLMMFCLVGPIFFAVKHNNPQYLWWYSPFALGILNGMGSDMRKDANRCKHNEKRKKRTKKKVNDNFYGDDL